jgi:hypothetical protein
MRPITGCKPTPRKLSFDAYLIEVVIQSGSVPSDASQQSEALESFVEGMTAWTSTHLPAATSPTMATRPFMADVTDEKSVSS